MRTRGAQPSAPSPSCRRVAKNKAQNEWRHRDKRNVLLAATPLTLALQHMLIDDGHVIIPTGATKRDCKRLFGQGIAAALAEMLAAREAK